jgi:hypothetical protein
MSASERAAIATAIVVAAIATALVAMRAKGSKEAAPKAAAKKTKKKLRRQTRLGKQEVGKRERFEFHVSRRSNGPSREVVCADVVQWLLSQDQLPPSASIIASVADISETPYDLATWKVWLHTIATLTFSRLCEGQCVIFYMTDAKLFNKSKQCEEWVHKVGICAKAAQEFPEMKLLWHKICTWSSLSAPQQMGVGTPKYTHMVCYGKAGKTPFSYDARASLSPDVVDRGPALWSRGMGLQACHIACDFLKQRPKTDTVVSLFCGVGTILAMANACGMSAVGVELCPTRCEGAKKTELSLRAVLDYRIHSRTIPPSTAAARLAAEDTGGAEKGPMCDEQNDAATCAAR